MKCLIRPSDKKNRTFRTILQFLTLGMTDPVYVCVQKLFYIFLVYTNNCAKHDTLVTATPPFRLASLWRRLARKIPEAPIVDATLHSRIDRQGRIKRRRNVRPSLWNYVTVNWANTTGAPLVRGPELVFCLRHRIPTVWPEYRITSNQSNSYLNETSNERRSSRDVV